MENVLTQTHHKSSHEENYFKSYRSRRSNRLITIVLKTEQVRDEQQKKN